MQLITSAEKWWERRVPLAMSIVFLCACGARSELAEIGMPDPASAPSSCPHDGGAGGDGFRGCVLHGYDVDGAALEPTLLTIPEVLPGASNPVEGYWLVGSHLGIGGADGEDHYFSITGNDVDTLFCGKSLSLDRLMNMSEPNHAVLLWWTTGTDYWETTSGTIEVIAFEPGTMKFERRPIHLEIHGAKMAPGLPTPGGATNHATGTFTADVSCRLEGFQYIPPD